MQSACVFGDEGTGGLGGNVCVFSGQVRQMLYCTAPKNVPTGKKQLWVGSTGAVNKSGMQHFSFFCFVFCVLCVPIPVARPCLGDAGGFFVGAWHKKRCPRTHAHTRTRTHTPLRRTCTADGSKRRQLHRSLLLSLLLFLCLPLTQGPVVCHGRPRGTLHDAKRARKKTRPRFGVGWRCRVLRAGADVGLQPPQSSL